MVIRLGEHDFSTDNDGALPLDFGVEKVEVYPSFTSDVPDHDLALIKLDSSVNLVRRPYLNQI